MEYSELAMFVMVMMAFKIKIKAMRIIQKQAIIQYKLFSKDANTELLVVDCTHPSAEQLTHHLKKSGQKACMDLSLRGDSSTDAAINAIKSRHSSLTKKFITSNHWDVDSFLSIWCCMNQEKAIAHELVLRECARIGDFRELRLDEDYQYTALQLACWLNSEERRLFYRPFESPKFGNANAEDEDDDDAKFHHFLQKFALVLANPESPDVEAVWRDEYKRVLDEYSAINALGSASHAGSRVEKYPDLGLVVVFCEEPVHYYALFSVTRGFDIVLSCYSGNRYELEQKYTTYVDIESRPSLPRVELSPLVQLLAAREEQLCTDFSASSGTCWGSNRITDTGPVMRLDQTARRLSRAERYGHPYERPIYPSNISSREIADTVVQFFQYAYGCHPSGKLTRPSVAAKKDWEWEQLHAFNKEIGWKTFQTERLYSINQ